MRANTLPVGRWHEDLKRVERGLERPLIVVEPVDQARLTAGKRRAPELGRGAESTVVSFIR